MKYGEFDPNDPYWEEPEYQDEVKHRLNEMGGVVIAKYEKNGKTVFDVRGVDERIYYETPAINWSIVRKEADRI